MTSARILAGLEFENQTSTSSTSPSHHSDLMPGRSLLQELGSKYSFERAKIDLEISRYEQAVRRLKTQRNSLAPISQLPPEILENIFTFCSLIPATSLPVKWTWIIVSHICHHWRTVALNCPGLWSRPDFFNTTWAYEMIKRSKMAPLTILSTVDWITPRMGDVIVTALQHISRASEIHLVASRDNMDKLMSGLSSPAPFLHSLVLDLGRSNYCVLPREPYVLPVDFLSGDAARLTKLELSQVSIQWDSPLLKNLTVLKFHLSSSCSLPAPTVTQFLNALERMPNLAVLDLDYTLPAYADAAEQRIVELPHLTKLRAVSSGRDCANLLNHISFPSTTSVNISCRGSEEPDLTLINVLCSRLSELLSRDESRQIKHLSLQSICIASGGIRLTAWNTTKKCSQLWLYLEFTWTSSSVRHFSESASAICSRLPLQHLRALSIISGYNDSLSAKALSTLFGTLPKLNTVSVEGNGVYELVEALNPVAAERLGTGTTFPSLRTLEFEEVDFDRDREEHNVLLEPLMDCLMLRCEYRSDLQKLMLVGCSHLFSHQVDQLKEIVVDVDWDELELGYTDSEEEDYIYDEDDFMSEDGPYPPAFGFGFSSWDDETMYLNL